MPTPHRIFYGCLGVADCKGAPKGRHISVSLSASKNITNIMSAGDKTPAITYPESLSVELTTTQYYNGFINDLQTEPGVQTPIVLDVMLGDETKKDNDGMIFLEGSSGRTVRCRNMFLNNISYRFTIDGPFTTTKKYSGWVMGNCSNSNNFGADLEGVVDLRRTYVPGSVGGFPSTHLTSVVLEQSINRQYVFEFGSRAIYAAYMVLPIKESLSLEGFASCSANGYTFEDINKSCINFLDQNSSLTISTCGAASDSHTLIEARLISLGYSGGDANSTSNMMVSASYDAIVSAELIKTTWISTDIDHTKAPCDC